MKTKVTKKEIRETGCKILKIGYCNAQYLLNYQTPFAYSAWREGWACDYYQIDDVIISTGYFPIGKPIDYSLVREYEEKAHKIYLNCTRENQKEKLDFLLSEFIQRAIAEK